MGNNTKSEQDNLCILIINPRLCKKVSIKVAIEQHDMKWLFRYGQILMRKIIKFNTIKTDFLLCRIIQDYRVENYVQEMRC